MSYNSFDNVYRCSVCGMIVNGYDTNKHYHPLDNNFNKTDFDILKNNPSCGIENCLINPSKHRLVPIAIKSEDTFQKRLLEENFKSRLETNSFNNMPNNNNFGLKKPWEL